MKYLFVAALVVLHRGDGGEVTINPGQWTTLREPTGPMRGTVYPGSRCVVGFADGKFVGVLETCAEVRDRLEGR